jgi:hypothetical protein
MRAEDRGEHLLDRRLAVAAADHDHGNRELPPPVRGERASAARGRRRRSGCPVYMGGRRRRVPRRTSPAPRRQSRDRRSANVSAKTDRPAPARARVGGHAQETDRSRRGGRRRRGGGQGINRGAPRCRRRRCVGKRARTPFIS